MRLGKCVEFFVSQASVRLLFVGKKVKENIVSYKNLTFSTALTVVNAFRNLLPTVVAKHLSADLLQVFQDGGYGGKG